MVRCVMDLPGDDHQGEGMIHLIFGGCFVNGQPAGIQDAFERVRAERACRDRKKGTDRTDDHEEDRRLVHHSPVVPIPDLSRLAGAHCSMAENESGHESGSVTRFRGTG